MTIGGLDRRGQPFPITSCPIAGIGTNTEGPTVDAKAGARTTVKDCAASSAGYCLNCQGLCCEGEWPRLVRNAPLIESLTTNKEGATNPFFPLGHSRPESAASRLSFYKTKSQNRLRLLDAQVGKSGCQDGLRFVGHSSPAIAGLPATPRFGMLSNASSKVSEEPKNHARISIHNSQMDIVGVSSYSPSSCPAVNIDAAFAINEASKVSEVY